MGIKLTVTKKPKKEFSKKILDRVTFFCVLVTIFTMALAWRTNDTTPLAYLIPAWFAEMATATAFYYNKAKAENLNKSSITREDDVNGI